MDLFPETVTSLTHRASTIVAASLWCHEDILSEVRKYPRDENLLPSWWRVMNNRVNENINNLPLTLHAKNCILDISPHIGKQLKDWAISNALSVGHDIIAASLCWKANNSLDWAKTVRKLIPYEQSVLNCFRVACINCLDEYIFKLWPIVANRYDRYEESSLEFFEVRFWVSYIQKHTDNLMLEVDYSGFKDVIDFAFSVSFIDNNFLFAEYFLKKMEKEQLQRAVHRALKYIFENTNSFNYKLIPYLTPYLSNEEQEKMFINYPAVVLAQYLNFPFCNSFLAIANRVKDILTNVAFYDIIYNFAVLLDEYQGTGVYKHLFMEFWENSPNHCKDYVIIKCIEGCFLIRVALLRNTDCIINSIICSSSPNQKKEIISNFNGMLFLDTLMKKERWNCFTSCIQEFAQEQENWVEDLIISFRDLYDQIRFHPTFSRENLENLIRKLESERNV